MVKKVLLLATAVIALVLLIAALRPSHFRVERSAHIPAPPAAVFAQVNDLHNWPHIAAWMGLDSMATFEGPTNGTGASCTWRAMNGRDAGRLLITASQPYEHVDLSLTLEGSSAPNAVLGIRLKPDSTGTRVTWSMDGQHRYINKVLRLFQPAPGSEAEHCERGLSALAAVQYPAPAGDPFPPLMMEYTVGAPRGRVWEAFTSAERMRRWCVPMNYKCVFAEADVRVNGHYRTGVDMGNGAHAWTTGTYLEVEPERRLRFTDSFCDSTGRVIPLWTMEPSADREHEQEVTIELEDRGPDSTFVRVQERYVSAVLAPQFAATWGALFMKLDEMFQGER